MVRRGAQDGVRMIRRSGDWSLGRALRRALKSSPRFAVLAALITSATAVSATALVISTILMAPTGGNTAAGLVIFTFFLVVIAVLSTRVALRWEKTVEGIRLAPPEQHGPPETQNSLNNPYPHPYSWSDAEIEQLLFSVSLALVTMQIVISYFIVMSCLDHFRDAG